MKHKYRTVFISDLHLGMRGAQARAVAGFLKRIECEKLYLVGDIIDMQWLKRRWYWPEDHNDVVRRILAMARRGTEVIFVPGNHDRAARDYAFLEFGGVRIQPHDIHETLAGQRLLVVHGDELGLLVKHSRWLGRAGGMAYLWLIRLNHAFNGIRRRVGLRYWSLSRYLKLKIKRACTMISHFEQTLIREAQRQGLDGVVCGHIHQPAALVQDQTYYYNCGDWLENCTAVVEHTCGRMEMIDGLRVEKADRAHRVVLREQVQTPG